MQVRIENVAPHDLEKVLELNEAEVPRVGRIDFERLRWFSEQASYFKVVKDGARFDGFLIGLCPGSDYASPNYRWFCKHYADFGYVDRVAIAAHARRRGLASLLYEDFAATLPKSVTHMTCEVNTRPPNIASMRFHTQLGFSEVGTLDSDEGRKTVALLVKPLLSTDGC
jgi:predicted GNAT superfamily acetyltransferase